MDLKNKRLLNVKSMNLEISFNYDLEGFISSFKTERNMKFHIIIMLLVILAGVLLKIDKLEWIICTICFAIVIAGEMFNTAIETVVNMITTEKNAMAKNAKDISAGAVLILAIGAAIIGLLIFVPKILEYIVQ